jgi:four helix bundle protein
MGNNKIVSFRDLHVWQKSMGLVDLVYSITKSFPDEERFGLTSQIRRSAVSIPSNIAEGNLRRSDKSFESFLKIALGSNAEVWTQIEIAYRLDYINKSQMNEVLDCTEQISKMLYKFISVLSKRDIL